MKSRTGSTADQSVRGRGTTLVAVAVLLVSVFVLLANEVQIGYYRIGPGSALDTRPLVQVDDEHYVPAAGKVLLTTVSLGKATILDAIAGWLDPAVDIVRERVIAPDTDPRELRQLNLQLMDQSKQTALAVAFDQLGVDVVAEEGAQIARIVEGTPAADALEVGDTVVAADGTPVTTHTELVDLLGAKSPGDRVTLTVESLDAEDGERRDVAVTLAENPDDPGKPFLGVSLITRNELDLPFPIDVQSNDIGGPSAGLAFTLEIIDVLSEGELTGGRTVAATGEIALDGSVVEIGGLAQKTTVVKASGADVFLVPASEAEQARRFAGDALQIIGVETIDDALDALRELGGDRVAPPAFATDDGAS